ncbi:hypothetical protein ZWY2020_028522 [Hordeum vulgare]|nr:hypothetical protein ZWY2020_028522 [Hordeum vulgare]
MDVALLEVLVHHHNMDDHSQNGWKSHVYTVAIKYVKEKCSKDITKGNILGRLRTFNKQFEVISKILSHSGFGCDWVNHKLSINSDDKGIGSYKTKVVRHRNSISTIYSEDHANDEGAMTGAENATETEESIEVSTEITPKSAQTGEDIMCMIGEMRTIFKDSLKTTDPLPLPKATTPCKILAAFQLTRFGISRHVALL